MKPKLKISKSGKKSVKKEYMPKKMVNNKGKCYDVSNPNKPLLLG